MCRAAITAFIPEIGFTEHFDSHPHDHCTGFFKADEWWEELTRCRNQFRDVLIIRAGIELSEPHQYPKAIQELLLQYPWDYALGALHWVGDEQIFQEPYFNRSEEEAYEDYFMEMLRVVETGEFDILAHMDVVKRYGFENYGRFNPEQFEGQIRTILHALATRNLALELNTVTLRRSVQETSPSKQILQWFHEEGGQLVTLGSDAHSPDHVGFGTDKAISMIQSSGFDNLTSFEGRKPKRTPNP
jgi:histidinol-phosphatase (PHP family)